MWRAARFLQSSARKHSRLWIGGVSVAATAVVATSTCNHDTALCEKQDTRKEPNFFRRLTLRKMKESMQSESVESVYKVDWKHPLGVGSFGTVYRAVHSRTGQAVALKKIDKQRTDSTQFAREMSALLHLQEMGSHPHLCSLRQQFEDDKYYYLILDLIGGGELFDHLVEHGAYSEREAARLVREVASALAFLHGLDTTHGDIKPENLMMSSKSPTDAAIKIVDFGCAQVGGSLPDARGKTMAYCPPEQLRKDSRMHPSMDVWALGVIIYILLTGVHPFDLNGNTPDDEVAEAVLKGVVPPIRNSPLTVHLSESALDVIEQCLERKQDKRITAQQLLEHPWVKGETAKSDIMHDIDKKLSLYRRLKSRIEKKVFERIVEWSDEMLVQQSNDIAKQSSLIERSFRAFDPSQKGYITEEDLEKATEDDDSKIDTSPRNIEEETAVPLSLSGFSDLLADNMKNKYFSTSEVVYNEGDIGNHMYFINSGAIYVKSGQAKIKRGPGDFFGEGALLNPTKKRSATIECATPVHALEISRDFFEKNVENRKLLLLLREKDKIRKRNRAKMKLRMQPNLEPVYLNYAESLYHSGEPGDKIYIVEDGKVGVFLGEKNVFTATPGNIFGEHSVIMGKNRNTTSICSTKTGCKVYSIAYDEFQRLLKVRALIWSLFDTL